MTKKNRKPDVPDEDSAHAIWLAGLGALAAAEEEGSMLFRSMVEKGEAFERRVKIRHLDAELPASVRQALQATVKPSLPDHEAQLLRRGGFELDAPAPGEEDPVARTAAEFAAILADCATPSEVAARLEVNPSRVRQRLGDRSLYGVRIDSRWHLPNFQFEGRGQIPGLAEVLRRLDPDLSPVAVARWFTSPSADLYSEELDCALSPRDWLLTGQPVQPVARLAAGI